MSSAGDALGTTIVNALSALAEGDKKSAVKCWQAIANQLDFVLTFHI